jgi:hypothetical protein
MSLNFPNVSVLGLSQEARFFEAGFQYASFRKLSIAGTVNDLTQTFGITGVWSGEEGVLATIRNNQNYQPLVLNGVSFGSGRIDNITFEPGLDVRLKTYQASITVFDSGNLFNFTGVYYSGVQTSNFQYLQAFSENYSFDKKLNGGYDYTHNASVQFTSGVGQLNAIQAAQSLARTLFTGSNLGFAFYPGYTNKQGKRYVSESYDLISNQCSFQETFGFNNDNGAYSATYTNVVQRGEDGVVTASEQGEIQGIENPNYQKALSAISVEMTGSYYRCSGAASFYFPTGVILIDSPTSQGRQVDIFNNDITYTVVFDNNLNNQRTYFWDYTLEIDKQDGISTASEQGSIAGRGENPTLSYQGAVSGFAIVKPGIAGRCAALFVGPYAPATNYLETKQESYSPVRGQLGYAYRYSNDPTLIANAGVRRKEVTVEENSPVYWYNKVGIVNVAEVIQNSYQATQGSTTVDVALEGDKTVGLSSFISAAVTEINLNKPVGLEVFVGDASYAYDITQNIANVSLTWLYNRAASQTTYPS